MYIYIFIDIYIKQNQAFYLTSYISFALHLCDVIRPSFPTAH